MRAVSYPWFNVQHWPLADLVTCTEETLNEKLHILRNIKKYLYYATISLETFTLLYVII